MALQIQLAKPTATWHPGDIVTGKVLFTPDPQTNVDRVELTFEGRVKSKLVVSRNNSSTTYRTFVNLFTHRATLFRGPYTLASPQEWPFAVQIPENCQGARTGNLDAGPSHKYTFNMDRNQPLPPTMSANDFGFMTPRKECDVSYRLNVCLMRSSAFKMHLDSMREIRVIPYREEAFRNLVPRLDVQKRGITTTSLHLDPEVGDRELKFKEKLKSTFASGNIPSVSYIIVVELPDSSIVSEPLPIFVSVTGTGGNDTTKSLPPIELKAFSLRLVRYTVQVTAGGSGLFRDGDRVESWDEGTDLLSWQGSVLLDGRVDLRSLYEKRFPKWAAVPSFRTFNVSRWYRLNLKATVACAKKQHTVEFYSSARNFTVLPEYCRSVAVLMGPPPPQDDEIHAVDLPSYGEALKSA